MCIVKDVDINKSVLQLNVETTVFVSTLINIGLSMDDSNVRHFGILRDVGQYFTMGGKKMKIKFLAIMFAAILVLGACGGNKAVDKDTNDGATTGTETAAVDAEKVVNTSCITCHGGNLEGKGGAPALNKVGDHMSETEIRDVIVNGRGGMPGGLIKDEEELDAVAKWLAEKK
jgi:cytochrome c551